MVTGFGASLPSYYDAAKQMTSSSLSPLGDLLGLFDSPKTSPEPAAVPRTHADSTSHGDSPAGSRQPDSHQPSSSHAPDEHRVPSPGGMTRGNDREQSALPEGTPRTSGSLQAPPGAPAGGSLRLASSSSWGEFHESEDTEAHRDSTGRMHAQPDHSSTTAAKPGSGQMQPDQATGKRQPDLAAARSGDACELRWAAPRHGSGSLPTSPFQRQPSPRPDPFDAQTLAEEHRGASADGEELAGGPEGSGPGTLGRGQSGSGQPSGRHRPNRSDAESMVSWGSFREPEQADAPTQTPNFPGQTPANDFLIRLSSTPSGRRSHSGDRETSEAGRAAPEDTLRPRHGTINADRSQHLDQLDEEGCWNGCMPAGPDLISDLISTGEPSQGGDALEDPFHHVALTEPLSQAQMHRDEGKKQRAAVSDWEDSQISGFAADFSGGSRHVPMRRAAGV